MAMSPKQYCFNHQGLKQSKICRYARSVFVGTCAPAECNRINESPLTDKHTLYTHTHTHTIYTHTLMWTTKEINKGNNRATGVVNPRAPGPHPRKIVTPLAPTQTIFSGCPPGALGYFDPKTPHLSHGFPHPRRAGHSQA